MKLRWWIEKGDRVKVQTIVEHPKFGTITWFTRGVVTEIVPIATGVWFNRDLNVKLDPGLEHPVTHETVIQTNTFCVERI